MAYDPSLGKTSEDFRFILFLREAQEKNKQKIRSHLGPVPQVRGRLCEAKPEAKSPWRCTQYDCDKGGRSMLWGRCTSDFIPSKEYNFSIPSKNTSKEFFIPSEKWLPFFKFGTAYSRRMLMFLCASVLFILSGCIIPKSYVLSLFQYVQRSKTAT